MIVYFTGTGNTQRVALRLAELLGDAVHELSPDELCSPADAVLETCNSHIIWAFPTYSWGVPPVVAHVMENVRLGTQAAVALHFMVTTCGDDMGYADRQWRKILTSRGLQCAGAYAVIMPNTYVCMSGFDVDSAQVAQRKLLDAPQRVDNIARAIAAWKPGDDGMPIRGRFPWIKTRAIYPWFVRHDMSPRPFRATDACVSCGLCARKCPMANISMASGRPKWGEQCALCLRCYHICPQHAVHYGSKTLKKGQYLGF